MKVLSALPSSSSLAAGLHPPSPKGPSHHSLATQSHSIRYLHEGGCCAQDLQTMDDPDVDHELIALLRESLGFSNKAQVGVSHNTGKVNTSLLRGSLILQSTIQ
jgi:hypothetical protein